MSSWDRPATAKEQQIFEMLHTTAPLRASTEAVLESMLTECAHLDDDDPVEWLDEIAPGITAGELRTQLRRSRQSIARAEAVDGP